MKKKLLYDILIDFCNIVDSCGYHNQNATGTVRDIEEKTAVKKNQTPYDKLFVVLQNTI